MNGFTVDWGRGARLIYESNKGSELQLEVVCVYLSVIVCVYIKKGIRNHLRVLCENERVHTSCQASNNVSEKNLKEKIYRRPLYPPFTCSKSISRFPSMYQFLKYDILLQLPDLLEILSN